MWKAIKPVLGQILTSKKALATIAAIIIWALAQAGVMATPEQVLPLLGVIAAFVTGQGIADIGKEAKKVEVQGVKELRALDPSLGKPEPASE